MSLRIPLLCVVLLLCLSGTALAVSGPCGHVVLQEQLSLQFAARLGEARCIALNNPDALREQISTGVLAVVPVTSLVLLACSLFFVRRSGRVLPVLGCVLCVLTLLAGVLAGAERCLQLDFLRALQLGESPGQSAATFMYGVSALKWLLAGAVVGLMGVGLGIWRAAMRPAAVALVLAGLALVDCPWVSAAAGDCIKVALIGFALAGLGVLLAGIGLLWMSRTAPPAPPVVQEQSPRPPRSQGQPASGHGNRAVQPGNPPKPGYANEPE